MGNGDSVAPMCRIQTSGAIIDLLSLPSGFNIDSIFNPHLIDTLPLCH